MRASRMLAVVLLAGTALAGCVHVPRLADCYDPLNPAATDYRVCPIDLREDHGGGGTGGGPAAPGGGDWGVD